MKLVLIPPGPFLMGAPDDVKQLRESVVWWVERPAGPRLCDGRLTHTR